MKINGSLIVIPNGVTQMSHDSITSLENVEHLSPENAGRSLEEIRQSMQPMNDYMKKRIVREGNLNYGCLPVGIKIKVMFCGYFDRNRPNVGTGFELNILTGEDAVFKCVTEAVMTMRPYEYSEFSIAREALYLRPADLEENLGDGIFSLEILEVENLTLVPTVQPEFSVICDRVKGMRCQAEEAMNRNCFQESVRLCEQATSLLKDFKTDRPEEQEERFNGLVAISELLLRCYDKRRNYWRVAVTIRELRRITNQTPSYAALVQEAKQHEEIGELELAREAFQEALCANPTNAAIHELIAGINARIMEEEQVSQHPRTENGAVAARSPVTIPIVNGQDASNTGSEGSAAPGNGQQH